MPTGARRLYPSEYNTWCLMRRRCYTPTDPRYKWYGARGITVCRAWRESFWQFFDDMGPRPAGRWLDRRNNDGNYTPANCRWATPKQQANNRRRRHWISNQRLDLTGVRFGRLVALKMVATWPVMTQWECRCDCGNIKVVRIGHLRNGHTQSCGCYHRERFRRPSRSTTPGT